MNLKPTLLKLAIIILVSSFNFTCQAQIFDQKLWLGGDIILEILGSSCESPHTLNTIKERIKKIAPGDSIYLKVLRRGKIIELTKKIN